MIRIVFTLNGGQVLREENPAVERIEELRKKAAVLWVDLEQPSEEEMDLVLRKIFAFHELAIADCHNETHHPKLDEYEDHLFVITNGIPDLKKDEYFRERTINAFAGEKYLVTVHLYVSIAVNEVMNQCLSVKGLAAKGTDHIYHLILDVNADQYIAALDVVNEEIENMEELVFTDPDVALLNKIIMEKRQILALYRTIRHQKEILNRLSTEEHRLITKKERMYYRNVYDHLMRVSDSIDFYREQANALLSVYLSVSSNKMNEVMEVLTIIATIILPLTLISGIYGMNFRHMPELHWLLGYPMALGMMVVVTLAFLWYFRKRKWL